MMSKVSGCKVSKNVKTIQYDDIINKQVMLFSIFSWWNRTPNPLGYITNDSNYSFFDFLTWVNSSVRKLKKGFTVKSK